jgi:dGTPase
LHSPSFRRLQGKTQLFPSEEHDFYRTRLTHSLEVAQIAKSIATRINNTHPYFRTNPIDLDLIEFAALAHDLGHPPFGHNGEYVLDHLMKDSGGFEGNAQTLRILSCLEKKATTEIPPRHAIANNTDLRRGLNVTYRSLASTLKYDNPISIRAAGRPARKGGENLQPVKGYYRTEEALVKDLKAHVGSAPAGKFKTIECSIMDVADDIAYSTYDIEDAFAANFLTPISILSVADTEKQKAVVRIQQKIDTEFADLKPKEREFTIKLLNNGLENIFADAIYIDQKVFQKEWSSESLGAAIGGEIFRRSEEMARLPYVRTAFTSDLIGRFIHDVHVVEDGINPVFWHVRPSFDAFTAIETLKTIAYLELINSDKFLADRWRATHIITRIFNALKDSGSALMTKDWRQIYEHYEQFKDEPQFLDRAICDFVSGMTNRFCVEFYERLFGVRPPSIHKP